MNPGLYVHVPFCRVRCPFCSFAITTELGAVDAWRRAVEREAALRAAEWREPFETVYLGGGTPSLLGAEGIAALLGFLRASFTVEAGAEVTIEANPGDLAPGDFARLVVAGVNRLSLGVQSFSEEDLKFLGREHSVEDSLASFRAARAEGFGNITIDLIYGLPGRTLDDWRAQIDRAVELGPDHVSAYSLTYEPGTPLARRRDRGEVAEPSEDESRDLLLLTAERFAEAGYEQYEVSSFARGERFQSRHNRKYWDGTPYLGLGPSAHSFRSPERWWNIARSRDYIRILDAESDPIAGRETLTLDERRLERLALALRTARGFRLDAFSAEFGADLRRTHGALLDSLIEERLLVLEGEILRPTARGLAVADELALRLSTAAAPGDFSSHPECSADKPPWPEENRSRTARPWVDASAGPRIVGDSPQKEGT